MIFFEETFYQVKETGKNLSGSPFPSLRIIYEERQFLKDNVTVISDIGFHQYWWAKKIFFYKPKYFLTGMGFQTMGIYLPCAIAAFLSRPKEKGFYLSIDESFLIYSIKLETAVRLKLSIVHMVWEDGEYNLVKIQQEQKYDCSFAASFGQINTIKYVQSFGIKALLIEYTYQIRYTLKSAFKENFPVVLSISIDYSDNEKIIQTINEI